MSSSSANCTCPLPSVAYRSTMPLRKFQLRANLSRRRRSRTHVSSSRSLARLPRQPEIQPVSSVTSHNSTSSSSSACSCAYCSGDDCRPVTNLSEALLAIQLIGETHHRIRKGMQQVRVLGLQLRDVERRQQRALARGRRDLSAFLDVRQHVFSEVIQAFLDDVDRCLRLSDFLESAFV